MIEFLIFLLCILASGSLWLARSKEGVFKFIGNANFMMSIVYIIMIVVNEIIKGIK